jgi:hypothetical protein
MFASFSTFVTFFISSPVYLNIVHFLYSTKSAISGQ